MTSLSPFRPLQATILSCDVKVSHISHFFNCLLLFVVRLFAFCHLSFALLSFVVCHFEFWFLSHSILNFVLMCFGLAPYRGMRMRSIWGQTIRQKKLGIGNWELGKRGEKCGLTKITWSNFVASKWFGVAWLRSHVCGHSYGGVKKVKPKIYSY